MKALAVGLVIVSALYGALHAIPSDTEFQRHVRKAAALMEAKEYARSIAELKAALAIDPYSVVAHDNLGIAYSKLGQYEAAVNEFKIALEINPAVSMTHNNLGYVYLEQKRYEEAKAEFKEALKTDADNDAAHNNLGRAYLELEDTDEARSEIRKALELNPQNKDARNNLLRLEKKIGSPRTASSHDRLLDSKTTSAEFKIITSSPSENLSGKTGMSYYRIGPTSHCVIEFNDVAAKRLVFKTWIKQKDVKARIYWSFVPESLGIGNKEVDTTDAYDQAKAETSTPLRWAGEISIPIPHGTKRLFLGASQPLYVSDLAVYAADADRGVLSGSHRNR